MTYRIREVEAFGGKQIILWLEDETTGAIGPNELTNWCVRLTVDEARLIIPAIFDAYAQTMQDIATELAAGGCRTCRNTRRDLTNSGPCPVCMPRAERRLRDKVILRRRR